MRTDKRMKWNLMGEKKHILRLWLPYAALSGWFLCFMRVCFRLAGRTGLLGLENALFMALCAGVVLGMLIPLPTLQEKRLHYRVLFRTACAAVIPCMIGAVCTQGGAALFLTFLATFFAAAAIGCSLHGVSQYLASEDFGPFFGTAFAASDALLFILLLVPINQFPIVPVMAGLCLLPLVAGLFYRDTGLLDRSDRLSDSRADKDHDPISSATLTDYLPAVLTEKPGALLGFPSKSTQVKYLAALVLYCVMAGLLDNLTTFDEAFFDMPNMLKLVFVYSFFINLSFGFLFQKINWNKLAMAGILLICAGQALPYFSTLSVVAVPYLVLTMMGIVVMEYIVRALPVMLARQTGRTATISRLGYVTLYGGFLVASFLFEYIPRGRYYFVMGIVLVLAFVILSLLYIAYSEEERRRYNRIMRALRDLEQADAADVQETEWVSDYTVRAVDGFDSGDGSAEATDSAVLAVEAQTAVGGAAVETETAGDGAADRKAAEVVNVAADTDLRDVHAQPIHEDDTEAGPGQGRREIPDRETRMEDMGLTAREREVCALLLSAYSLKQVAVTLQIAYGTANKHYTSIYRKLNISSKAELFQIFGVSVRESISGD